MKFLSIGAGCQSGLGVHRCWMSISAGCSSVLDVPQCWMSHLAPGRADYVKAFDGLMVITEKISGSLKIEFLRPKN